jgi:hypothetical protein
MKTRLFTLIKGISIVLIASALSIELWNLSVYWIPHSTLDLPFWMVGFARFALIAHLIEGAIATFYAPTKQQKPMRYGVYTFFVGTVGLWELFDAVEMASGDRTPESCETSG